ncbi:MAG: hypothetical protein K5858_10580 [Lachnospiraceae bacterium]|nr:hypothetical protein [Lachnospiraceae bacterium]
MKNLLKQPLLWVGLLFLVVTIACCVVAPKMHYSYSIVNKYEKAVKKNDIAGVIKLYAPEDREGLTAMLKLFGGDLSELESKSTQIYTGKMTEEEDGKATISTIEVNREDETPDMVVSDVELKKVDNKYYLSEY